MLSSAGCGIKSQLKDAVTKNFQKAQRKKEREAARAKEAERSRRLKRYAPPVRMKQYDLREMLTKRFKKDF